MAKQKREDELTNRIVVVTDDYDRFKKMTGNRKINKVHVNQLIRLMTTNGNLTDQFPIVVNENMFVVDGQHRLEALKILGWEVGYVIDNSSTLATVRQINQGAVNWSWRDIAESYASTGNKEYDWFLRYCDKHSELSYTLAMAFCDSKASRHSMAARNTFGTGGLVIEDKAQAELYAQQYEELLGFINVKGHDYGKAMNRLFRSPFYSHDRMVEKTRALGHQLPMKANITDYQRDTETIFNHGLHESSKVRLF